MTKAQRAILDAVTQSGRHLSADEVYRMVKPRFHSIALGTIYRNLHRFADDKRIRRVTRAGAADYFEGNTAPHDHALCVCCGKVTDLEIPALKDFLKERMQEKIVSFDLMVQCICPNCAQGGAPDFNKEDEDAAQDPKKIR